MASLLIAARFCSLLGVLLAACTPVEDDQPSTQAPTGRATVSLPKCPMGQQNGQEWQEIILPDIPITIQLPSDAKAIRKSDSHWAFTHGSMGYKIHPSKRSMIFLDTLAQQRGWCRDSSNGQGFVAQVDSGSTALGVGFYGQGLWDLPDGRELVVVIGLDSTRNRSEVIALLRGVRFAQ